MFKNSIRRYLQIKGIAEEVVDRLLKEREPFLDLAFKAVIEALQMSTKTITLSDCLLCIITSAIILVVLMGIYTLNLHQW